MNERPQLSKELDVEVFNSYYYLKEELVSFCRECGLPTSGRKETLNERIAHYLRTKEVLKSEVKPKIQMNMGEIKEDTLIEEHFVCSQKHREFFKQMIGKSFSFNVLFQKWLKENHGKPYASAVEAYYQILEEKKLNGTSIDRQFEYNTYIRDFFLANDQKTLKEAIICWKYKKAKAGHHRYEEADLIALDECIKTGKEEKVMKVKYVENYEAMSQCGAQLMIDMIQKKANANICLATGGSPLRMYEIFVEEVLKQHIDVSQVYFTKLDDWCGLSERDEETCEYFILKHVLRPLKIASNQVISFNLKATDYAMEAQRIQTEIMNRPLDLCVLGLGMNGHLGLNEPADELYPYAHTIPLSEKTKTHSMLRGKNVEFGITLGMSELLGASEILMLVTGQKKEEAYQQFMSEKVSTQVPASFLWLHKNCQLLIDESCFKKAE